MLLERNGYSGAEFYPLWYMQAEADRLRNQLNNELRTSAALQSLAAGAVRSKMGAKVFKDALEKL